MASRDTHLIQAVAEHLEPYHGEDTRLGILLSYSVGRILLNVGRKGDDWKSLASDTELRHISDWIKAAIVNDADWLSIVDALGRPKKLLKGGTIQSLTAEADKAMIAASKALAGGKIEEGAEELYQTLGDGFYIVRLLTPDALDRESAGMQHCIGDGAYDDKVSSKRNIYLSLRGPNGKPHATMEVTDGVVVQLSGKQNRTPIRQYMDRLIPFIRGSGFGCSLSSLDLGYVIARDGTWHDINAIPDNTVTNGHVQFGHTYDGPLPNGLHVKGSLILGPSKIRALPSGLVVESNLQTPKDGLDFIPDDLHVFGALFLERVESKLWPPGAKVDGIIFVGRNVDIVFPDGFTTAGGLNVNSSGVTSLPFGLSVGHSLKIDYSSIASLPDGLHVGKDLDISYTPVDYLPPGLSVKGDLIAFKSGLQEFHPEVSIGKSIDVRRSPLKSLPENLHVDGDLLLSGTNISVLPCGLRVNGKLDIVGLPLSELPDCLFAKVISLAGTSITSLPDGIPDDTVIYDEDGETTAAGFRAKNEAGWVRPVFQYVKW
jgi:hypothetical protein